MRSHLGSHNTPLLLFLLARVAALKMFAEMLIAYLWALPMYTVGVDISESLAEGR